MRLGVPTILGGNRLEKVIVRKKTFLGGFILKIFAIT
jgi:hypothetical protein